jgi:two-component system, NarL family, nitrate/nitrite response regulator NarL
MIRVVVVGDVRLYREGLVQALGATAGIQVVGTATHPDEALAVAGELRPDILLVDTAMPESLSLIQGLARDVATVRVVALALTENEAAVVEYAEAGIAGLVSKEGSLGDLIATIESTARGELLCSPRTAATLLRRLNALAAGHARMNARLTGREMQILHLVGDGLSNKEIATRLGVEVATVKNHVHNILEKLRVHRRGEAAAQLRAVGRRRDSDVQPMLADSGTSSARVRQTR